MLTWIVGRGGLFGRALSRVTSTEFVGLPVQWQDHAAAVRVLDFDLKRFIHAAGSGEWSIIWAAGSGVVGSTVDKLAAETRLLTEVITRLRDLKPEGRGALFFTSSAGGVYAGSAHPPFSESTIPCPLSPYGEEKLAQEQMLISMLEGSMPLVIGRVANLVGPGQDLVKQQGLVSQMCQAAVTRRSVNVFVPMETLRDYLCTDDAAAMVRALVFEAVRNQPLTPMLRNISSQRPMSICSVLRTVEQVGHRTVRIALGTSPSSKYHVRDLRLRTQFQGELQGIPITPFPVVVKRVYDDLLWQHAVFGHCGRLTYT